MKMKIKKIILNSTVLILIFFSICIISGSADETLTVNGKNVSKGDTVTFTFYMSDVKDPIEAAGAYINFNPEFLEYIDGSIGFDVLQNAMINVGEESIYYCAINVIDGFDFKEEGLVVTLSFKVLDTASGATVITNTFDEIFTFVNEEEDLTPDDYTSRTVISVNDTSGNAAVHSGVNAADVTETSDIIVNSADTDSINRNNNDTKNGISVWLIVSLAAALLAAAAVTVVFLKKRNNK